MIVSEKELCISNEADSSSSVRHRKAIIALLVIAAVLIAALAGAWDMFGTQLTAAMTIEKLDDNLWAMEYKGDYGFDGFLEQGGAKSDAEMGDYIASFLSHGFRILAEAVERDLPYEIKCPALLICGEQDKAGSCVRYNKAWHKNSGIPLEWIKDAGHNSNTDQPEIVNRLIEQLAQRAKCLEV